MSAPEPELGQEIHRDYTFTSIPKLGPVLEGDQVHSLLPQYGGRSGYVYAQWPIELQRTAQDRGWEGVSDTRSYTIVGPEGQIDCILLCKGDYMPDTDLQSNRRKMYVHTKIAEVTGLSLKTGLIPDEDETKELVEAEPSPAFKDGKRIAGFGTLSHQPEGTPVKFDETVPATSKEELELSHDPVPKPTNKGKKS